MNYSLKKIDLFPDWDPVFFNRLIICRPEDKSYFEKIIKAEDIRLIASNYLQPGSFMMTTDCTIRMIDCRLSYQNNDFELNQITVTPEFEIT